jgi:hypothetical protein
LGRYVYEKYSGEFVWKYYFAKQASEQYRIAEELGIGKIEYEPEGFYGDYLYLKREDIPKLKKWLKNSKTHLIKARFEGIDDKPFVEMVRTYEKFMERHKDQPEFIFMGEY